MLASNPRLPTAWLIAVIVFDSISYIVLGRYDYRDWIPEEYCGVILRAEAGRMRDAVFERNVGDAAVIAGAQPGHVGAACA